MRRYLLAVAALLTAGLSVSFADYLIIRVLLESGAAPAGVPGDPFGGVPGVDGGPGVPGATPFRAPGDPGPGPGRGGEGGPGRPLPTPMPTPMPGTTPGTPAPGVATLPPAPPDPARSVVVLIPVTGKPERKPFLPKYAVGPGNPPWELVVKQKDGWTYLFTDNSSVQLYQDALKEKNHEDKVRREYDAAIKAKNPAALRDVVRDALRNGLGDVAAKAADDLLANKAGATGAAADFAKAYEKVAPQVKAAATGPHLGEKWKGILQAQKVHTDKHYALIYWDQTDAEVRRAAALLEANFQAFYLWHALQGVELPVPPAPLLVVLPKRARDVVDLKNHLDGLPIHADGFFAPAHDLLILSPDRMDDIGQTFQRQSAAVFRDGIDRGRMLKGVLELSDAKDRLPDDMARMSTYVLVDKYAEDEAEWASVSRQATRQLAVAAGLLPRNVVLPNWVQQGYGALLERPPGAFFDTRNVDKPRMSVGFEKGTGSPHLMLFKLFEALQNDKRLHPDPAALLRNVVTDSYFAAVRAKADLDPVPPLPRRTAPTGTAGVTPGTPAPADPAAPGAGGAATPGVAQEADLAYLLRLHQERVQKAQATAWALTYWAAEDHNRLKKLYAFYAELDKLPRDLPTDPDAAAYAFAAGFDLLTADKTAIDVAKFKALAAQWVEGMKSIRAPVAVDIDVLPTKPPTTTPDGTTPPAGAPAAVTPGRG